MGPARSLLALLALGILAPGPVAAHSPQGTLFVSSSKDKRVRRIVLENGDYCQVREYLGQEHTGVRVAYFIPERDASEQEIKSIIGILAKKYCGEKEASIIIKAIKAFKAPSSGNVDHWVIDLKDQNHLEFFILVDLIGESIAIQIKYST